MSIGLDQTIANLFALHPDCKSLQNLVSSQDLDPVNGKEMQHFCCEKAAFFNFFGFHLDLVFTVQLKEIFGLRLDLD